MSRRPKNDSVVVSTRVTPAEAAQLLEIAREEDRTPAAIIRRALRATVLKPDTAKTQQER